ncbi:MAG: hypothetical protein EBU84_17425 [Actinobacteria bacterium]|nr:hypothetical protein [Actinomycetota bacterium]
MGCQEETMKLVRHDKIELAGHVLARRSTRYTHVVEFTPMDRSFVRIRSWNAPEVIGYPAYGWTLLTQIKLKKQAGRELWLAMRKRGYWVWIGGKSPEMKEATCA